MSRIYFHNIEGQAEVRGSERAYGNLLITRMTEGVLGVEDNVAYLKKYIPKSHYLYNEYSNNPRELAHCIKTALHVGDKTLFEIDDLQINPFELGLNTAIVMGSNPIRLYARIHGQCEIHCYVEGKNRKWLAEIIKEGLDNNIMRDNSGWESVIELLNKSDKSPVITSYSVCSQFPNPYILDLEGEDVWAEFEKLTKDEQWGKCMDALRNGNLKGLELQPENFDKQGFGNGISAFDLVKIIWEKEKK